jgi:hypothetical protein
MPQLGFEPTIPVFQRAKTVHALDGAAIVIGRITDRQHKLWVPNMCTAACSHVVFFLTFLFIWGRAVPCLSQGFCHRRSCSCRTAQRYQLVTWTSRRHGFKQGLNGDAVLQYIRRHYNLVSSKSLKTFISTSIYIYSFATISDIIPGALSYFTVNRTNCRYFQ